MPRADATVLAFGSPLFLTILSIPIFKEQVDRHRWAAVLLGFLGVLIVLDPTADVFQPAGILVVLASLCFSGSIIMGRMLGATEPVIRIVFYNNIGIGVMALPVAALLWAPMPLEHVAVVALMAMLAVAGHYRGLHRCADGGGRPLRIHGRTMGTHLGLLHLLPGANVIYGAPITIAAGLYIVYREDLHRRAVAEVSRRESMTGPNV